MMTVDPIVCCRRLPRHDQGEKEERRTATASHSARLVGNVTPTLGSRGCSPGCQHLAPGAAGKAALTPFFGAL